VCELTPLEMLQKRKNPLRTSGLIRTRREGFNARIARPNSPQFGSWSLRHVAQWPVGGLLIVKQSIGFASANPTAPTSAASLLGSFDVAR
jgi:hypothetical protein